PTRRASDRSRAAPRTLHPATPPARVQAPRLTTRTRPIPTRNRAHTRRERHHGPRHGSHATSPADASSSGNDSGFHQHRHEWRHRAHRYTPKRLSPSIRVVSGSYGPVTHSGQLSRYADAPAEFGGMLLMTPASGVPWRPATTTPGPQPCP